LQYEKIKPTITSHNNDLLWFNFGSDMTAEQFTEALDRLGWKQTDFCRMAGLNKSTPSRWMAGAEIPEWVPKFLGMAIEVKRLHDTYVVPPKPGKAED
jgi:hypothetical protein